MAATERPKIVSDPSPQDIETSAPAELFSGVLHRSRNLHPRKFIGHRRWSVGEEIRFEVREARPATENILVRSKSRLRAIDSFVLPSKGGRGKVRG